jgi:hypothetical protein
MESGNLALRRAESVRGMSGEDMAMRRKMTAILCLVLCFTLTGCYHEDDSRDRRFRPGDRVRHRIGGREGVILGNYTKESSSEPWVLVQFAATKHEMQKNTAVAEAGVIERYFRDAEFEAVQATPKTVGVLHNSQKRFVLPKLQKSRNERNQ